MQLPPARGPPRLTALQLVSMLTTYFKEENMTTEGAIYVVPTVIYRAGPGTLETATVENEERGRALFVFRSEEEANDYRRTKGVFPEEEGFRPVTLDVEALRDVLRMHDCTHVVTPVSLVGEEEPDFFSAEDFLWMLEESPAIEVH